MNKDISYTFCTPFQDFKIVEFRALLFFPRTESLSYMSSVRLAVSHKPFIDDLTYALSTKTMRVKLRQKFNNMRHMIFKCNFSQQNQ